MPKKKEKCENCNEQNQEQSKQLTKRDLFWQKIWGILSFCLANFVMIGVNYVIKKYYFDRYMKIENHNGILPYDTKQQIFFILYEILHVLMITSYYRVVFSDPGYIPQKIEIPQENILGEKLTKICVKCKNQQWKPPRAHHCKYCNKCVQRQDHHCVWISNCVGIKNLKFFIQFTLFTGIACIISIIFLGYICYFYFNIEARLIVKQIILNNPHLRNQKQEIVERFLIAVFKPTFGKITCSFAVSGCFFFMLFTLHFVKTQISLIIKNQSLVDQQKKMFGKKQSFYNNFKQVFGSPKSFRFWITLLGTKNQNNYLECLYTEEDYKKQKDPVFIKNKEKTQTFKRIEDNFTIKDHQHYKIFQKYKF